MTPNLVSGQAIGTVIAVANSTDLAAMSSQGIALGTRVYNIAVGAYFALTASTSSLVTDSVVAVSGITGQRWVVVPAAPVVYTPTNGANIGPSGGTISPISSHVSEYVIPPNTLTGLTGVTISGASSGYLLYIVREDLTANQFFVNNGSGSGGEIYRFPDSPAGPMRAAFKSNGTDWQFVSVEFVTKQ